MTIAELHGKISSSGRNLHDQMEDLLTSDVFSACKYLRPSKLLLPFLSTAISLDHAKAADLLPKEAAQTTFHFWPRLDHGEPDLVIVIKDLEGQTHLAIVEAKYLSGKSSTALEEEELEVAAAPSDQLAAEYEDLLTLENQLPIGVNKIKSRSLIYITAHRSIPVKSIAESMREIERFHPSLPAGPIYWTNWFALVPLLTQPQACEVWETPIMEDLHALMIRKGFVKFDGFGIVEPLKPLEGKAFYAVQSARFGGGYGWEVPKVGPTSWYVSHHGSDLRSYFQGVTKAPIVDSFYKRGYGNERDI